MRKEFHIVTAIMIILISGCQDNEPENFNGEIIPLSIGNSWSYQTTYFEDGDSAYSFEYDENIIDSFSINDTLCYIVQIIMDDSDIILRSELWTHLGNRIFRKGIISDDDTIIFDTPEAIVKYPVSFGERIFVDTFSTIDGQIDSLFWIVSNLSCNIQNELGNFNCTEYYSYIQMYSIEDDIIDTVFNETRLYLAPGKGIIRLNEYQNHELHSRRDLVGYNIN